MPRILIIGGIICDKGGFRRQDLVLEGDSISEVSSGVMPGSGDRVIDAAGKFVLPALVDPHTHLRVPGGEEAETLISGTQAAALGGYCAVLAMPNTEPALDSPARILQLRDACSRLPVKVIAAASITKDRAGRELSSFAALAKIGVPLVTDDGSGVQDAHLMRRALEYCSELPIVVAQHAEVSELFRKGVMNEGKVSAVLGVAGIPASSEEVMVARDIELARSAQTRIHFLHLSTGRSADLVARAKQDGVAVSAEVTPHHLTFDDGALVNYDSTYKVNPPLRGRCDVERLWDHLGSGTFDVIGTDHAPHPQWKKQVPLEQAAFGMLGLQHSLSAIFAGIAGAIERKITAKAVPDAVLGTIANLTGSPLELDTLSWLWLVVSMMSWKPAEILGLAATHGGEIASGALANLVIFDPEPTWFPTLESLRSKASNSPYLGSKLKGRIDWVFVDGRVLVENGELNEKGNWT